MTRLAVLKSYNQFRLTFLMLASRMKNLLSRVCFDEKQLVLKTMTALALRA